VIVPRTKLDILDEESPPGEGKRCRWSVCMNVDGSAGRQLRFLSVNPRGRVDKREEGKGGNG
jgi:hypothetical protein